MSVRDCIPNYDNLTRADKLAIVDEIWDDLSGTEENSKVAEAQKRLLDRRYQEFLENPQAGESWDQVRKELEQM